MKRKLIFTVAAVFATLFSQPAGAADDDRGKARGGGGRPTVVQQAPANRGATANRPIARGTAPITRGSVNQGTIQRSAVIARQPGVVQNRSVGTVNRAPAAVAQRPAVNSSGNINRNAVANEQHWNEIRARNAASDANINRSAVASDRHWDQIRARNSGNDRRTHDWDNTPDRGWSQYRYYHAPYAAYRGWDHNRFYSWHNYRYRYFGDSWVIVDPGYAYDPGYTEGAVVSSPAAETGSLVSDVQAQLARAGYDPGPVDGVLGQGTRNAIAQFQADRGLAVTGRIDSPLIETLGLRD